MANTKQQTINDKLSKIQTTLKAPKTRTNSFAKYKYRSAEDILESVKPLLRDLDVSLIINEELISTDNGLPIMKSIATLVDNRNAKNSLSAVALVGVDLNSKGQQKPQQFGAASSYGKKYALGNLFLLDDTQDADATNDHNKKQKPTLTKSHPQFQKSLEWLAKSPNESEFDKRMLRLQDAYVITDKIIKQLNGVKPDKVDTL